MIAYGTKPMELKQDLKAIENEPIKSELERLKESSKLLWKANIAEYYCGVFNNQQCLLCIGFVLMRYDSKTNHNA